MLIPLRRFRTLTLLATFSIGLFGTTSCQLPFESDLNKIADELQKGIDDVNRNSDAWRDALKNSIENLKGLESQVSSDVKQTLVDTINSVTALKDQTFKQADYYAKDVISYAAIQVQCSADYFKASVGANLELLKARLTNSKAAAPTQRVCLFNPDHLDVDPSTPLDSTKTWNVNVFGYNFFSDSLPFLGIYDGMNQLVRAAKNVPIRTSTYQMQLQLIMADFGKLDTGYRVGFKWSNGDRNFISLNLSSPAHLKVASLSFPSTLVVNHTVVPHITIQNTGSADSGLFLIKWIPDVTRNLVQSISEQSVGANQTQTYDLPAYAYRQQDYFNLPSQDGKPIQSSLQIQSNTGVGSDTTAIANFTLYDLPFHQLPSIRIDNPTVTAAWTSYQQRVGLQPGDIVTITDAGGCVQTGGSGDTWKHYVFPYAPDAPNLYHGLVSIDPIMPRPAGSPPAGAVRLMDVLNRPIQVPLDVYRPTFYLGYEDQNYSDNGYYSHDNGTGNQCLNLFGAWATVSILRN